MIDNDKRAGDPAEQRQRRRRSANPRRRQDPERTRQAILDAANAEFGEYGFNGARVMRIAAAAGVNHQLITYHFGSKQGLYDAISEGWITRGANMLIRAAEPLAEIIRDYVGWAHDEKVPIIRTLVRAELDGKPSPTDERTAQLLAIVEETRNRQARGEIRDDLDAGALTLALMTAAMAPEILPQLAATVTGADPASPEFLEHYANLMSHVIYALARVPEEGPAGSRMIPPEGVSDAPDEDQCGS